MDGGTPSIHSPVIDHGRNPDLLIGSSDIGYRSAYDNTILDASLQIVLPSNLEFQRFTIVIILAIRSAMSQVLCWIPPSPKLGKNRYSLKKDMSDVLNQDLF